MARTQKILDRDEYYMEVAKLTAKRGTCNRLQVGCVLVDANTKRIASVGYNSSHSKTPHCSTHGCMLIEDHCIRTLHAEQAACANLEKKYDNLVAYVTDNPCVNCYKLLAAFGVKKIYYLRDYTDISRERIQKFIKVPTIKFEK